MSPKNKVTSEGDKNLGLVNPEEVKIPFKEGQILADVKISRIDPKVHKSIYFVMAKRQTRKEFVVVDGKNEEVTIPDVIVKGEWNQEERCMTLEDFTKYIEGRSKEYDLGG